MSRNDGGDPSFESTDEGYSGLAQDEPASGDAGSVHLVSVAGGELSLDEGEVERMLQHDEENGGSLDDDGGENDNHNVGECKQVLPRTLTLWDAVAVVVGIQIGTGIFASPGVVLAKAESVGLSLVIWVLAGVLAMLGGLCYAELGATWPTSGGEYHYFLRLGRRVGGPIAFVFIWAMFFIIKAGSQAIISIIFARYMGSVLFSFSITDHNIYVKLVACGAIVCLTAINCAGARWGAFVQKISMAGKILSFLFVVAVAIYFISRGGTGADGGFTILRDNFKDAFNRHDFEDTPEGGQPKEEGYDVGIFFAILSISTIAALWSYDGWGDLNSIAEEIKNPQRNMAISILAGTGGVMAIYLFINVAYLAILTTSEIVHSRTVAVDSMVRVIGEPGRYVVSILIATSALGALNGSIMTGGRLFFAAARDGNFPFSSLIVNERIQSPLVALILQGVWAAVLIFPGNFESLLSYFGFTSYLWYGSTVVTLMVLRSKEPNTVRPFKVFPYPLVPVLFVLASVVIVVASLVQTPEESCLASLCILAAVPFYYLFIWKGNKPMQWCSVLWRKVTGKEGATHTSPKSSKVPVLVINEEKGVSMIE